MDTKGVIAEHSRIKLTLYSRYLQSYLGVFFNSSKFESIVIHDIFAGSGIASNDEKGSALIAAEVIRQLGKVNRQRKTVTLNLNDADSQNFRSLQTHLGNYRFAKIHNETADTYISSLMSSPGQHCLFFIDPHGYTQISATNLVKLFSWPKSDLLLFVPLSHVHRFLRREDDDEQMKPIARFLRSFGIDELSAKDTTVVEFADLVKGAIGKLSNKNWVSKKILRKKLHSSTYCLFFLAEHIRGAEKFLDAKETAEREPANPQIDFDFIEEIDYEQKTQPFKAALQPGAMYDNTQLYELGIRHDLRPAEVSDLLKQMEEQRRIAVTSVGTTVRRGRHFYLQYDYYKKNDRRISVTLK